jgi:modulator of FtsH protease HflC
MKKQILAALVVVALLFAASSSTVIIDETELAIITQFGEYKRTLDRPGLHYKIPLVQTTHVMERRILVTDTPPAEYLTLDKKRIVADPILRWRIEDPLLLFKSVHDETGARARLNDIVSGELRRELASHNFGEIVGNARDPMMQAVGGRTREKSLEFGIHVVDVRIKRADLPKEVQESVFARMRAERDRVAKQYRSEGEEEAAKIRADTDKEKTILLAKAYETAQTLRGEGDAEGTRIYAEAYGKDAEFYAFTRSLEAYERGLHQQSTVVLASDSPIFRYLSSPDKRAP